VKKVTARVVVLPNNAFRRGPGVLHFSKMSERAGG
jgi:hypothetical protein